VADTCSLEDCEAPAVYHARIEWRDVAGSGTHALTVPVGFCEEHSRSLRTAAPSGAVWLEYFSNGD
jgi:hypothetical protein